MARPPTLSQRDDVVEAIAGQLPIHLEYYDDRYLRRRIAARMRRAGVAGPDEYLAVIEADGAEREALINSLSINVTGFFRNPDVWASLRSVLRRRTSDQRGVRVWSAPCADGREPYSVALLALDDPQIDVRRLEVIGTDVSEEALATARDGVYRTGTTNDIAAELDPLRDPDRYVTHEEGTFRVHDRVRELVEFQLHDLIHDDPLTGMDIVLCRNLLIYIHPDYERLVFDTVSSALESGGILVVGMTESSTPERADAFETLDRQNRIYRKI